MNITDKSCGIIPYRIKENQIYFLLIKHAKNGHWAFPKGHPEADETDKDAALRELQEETGITTVKILPEAKFQENYSFINTHGEIVNKTVIYFLGHTEQNNIQVQEAEVSDYVWLPYSMVLGKITFDESKKLIRQAYNFLIHNQNSYYLSE